MNTIYLDTLFLINFLTDYITLLCTAKVGGAGIHRPSIALASLIGGLYACLCACHIIPWAETFPVKLAFAFLLCLISFGKEERLFRCCFLFLLISAAFGGIMSAFLFSFDGVAYLHMDFKVLLVTFVLVYFLLSHLLRRFPQLHQRQFHEITITFHSRTLTLTALRDTGNELYDPTSNLPVLICEKDLMRQLLPELEELYAVDDPFELFCQLNEATRLVGKMRLIPFQSLAGNGMLMGFRPDQVLIDGQPTQLIVAFTDKPLSQSNLYHAIY